MWTIATRVNPPAARPTPQRMSKPIQIPHGKLSLRCVEAPRPRVKRINVATAPSTRITPAATLQKVRFFKKRCIENLLGWSWSLLAVGRFRHLFLHFFPALGNPPDAEKENTADADDARNLRQRVPGEHRERG